MRVVIMSGVQKGISTATTQRTPRWHHATAPTRLAKLLRSWRRGGASSYSPLAEIEGFHLGRIGRRGVQQLLLHLALVVPRADHAVAVDLARAFDRPVLRA